MSCSRRPVILRKISISSSSSWRFIIVISQDRCWRRTTSHSAFAALRCPPPASKNTSSTFFTASDSCMDRTINKNRDDDGTHYNGRPEDYAPGERLGCARMDPAMDGDCNLGRRRMAVGRGGADGWHVTSRGAGRGGEDRGIRGRTKTARGARRRRERFYYGHHARFRARPAGGGIGLQQSVHRA